MNLIKTKNTVIILLLLFICSILNAQSPQKISFQAVIRNASNTVISLRPIGIKISLLQGSALGKLVYAETQTVTTNFNGLISIQIGTGNVVYGSFSAIDWANGPYFIKTETDPNGGNDYTIIGTSELLSVPYALFALNSNTTHGLIGATGLTGETGAKGLDGINGVDGIDGINGIDAINGEQKIISGHTVDYYRGDKTWQVLNSNIVAEGANKYFTEARARLSVSAGVGLHYDSTTGIMRSTISDANYIQLDALSSIAIGLDYHKNTGIFQLSPTYFIPNSNNLSGMNTGDQVLPTLVSLNGEPKIDIGINSEYYSGDKTWQILNANAVGLNQVNNTSDINKPISTATAAFVLDKADRYNAISAGNEIFTTSITDILADGLSFTPNAGKYIVNFNSQYTIDPGNLTEDAFMNLTAVYAHLMGKTVTNSIHGVAYGAGEILSPGVYRNAGAVTTTGTLTLDAGGDPNAEFIFQFGAAMSTGAGFKVILSGGASACNVYWIAEGAIALGASTEIMGMLISNSGAVSLGSSSNVQGNLYSSGGAIGIDASTVSKLTGCMNNFNNLRDFVIFTKSGVISNTGLSTLNGNIGSSTGTISGFETSNLNGKIVSAGASDAIANFSIYQHGELVPFSTRKRISGFKIGEVNLQAIATVATGENIEIRWNIDIGKVKMQNRIFTIQQVR
jgi:hypothetical protein